MGGVKESIHLSWLAKGLGLGLICWGFKGDQEEIPREEASTLQMGIKTVHHPPYSPDLAPCDFCLFPKLRGCGYETIEEIKESVTKVIDTLTQEDFHWGLPEVVGMVQQVHCSRRRLLQRRLEFHVCTINRSGHTKKMSGNLFNDPPIYLMCICIYISNVYVYIYIYIYMYTYLACIYIYIYKLVVVFDCQSA